MKALAAFALLGFGLLAQAADGPRTVFVETAGGGASASVVRQRVIERLRKSRELHLASSAAAADAVLKIDAVIWPSGMETPNPRSRNVTVTGYDGYASAELVDKADRTLWSSLVTPSRFHFGSTAADLGDELSASLTAAEARGIQALPASQTSASGAATTLKIAGATFPAPLYRKWFESFGQAPGGFAVSYSAIGSAAGIEEVEAGKIDVAASDIDTLPSAASSQLRLFPSVVGGVVPIYNLPELGHVVLDLTPEVLAGIYLGEITRWNDPRIRAINRGAHLPNAAITVVHRSDGSGTTYVWTKFLAETSPQWRLPPAPSIDWPVGEGAAGSLGVVKKVTETPDAIGYVELTYAIQNRATYAAVRNRAGRFIKSDLASLVAAAQPSDTSGGPASILNSPRGDAYPIASFTWFLVPEGLDAAKRKAVSDLLEWTLTTGQRQCSSLAYAPLPRDLVRAELKEAEALK